MLEAPVEEAAPRGRGTRAQDGGIRGDVCFRDVSFSYVPDKPVLSRVSFTIPEGKTTALVGQTGCGKTTVLKLLERLYEPTGGQVTIGGTPIGEVDLHRWRGNISYVVQEALMFGGTVRNALLYGVKRDVADEEILEVTKKTGIYDFIMDRCSGLDGEVASWGQSMSGGQRQRFVIAREMLKNAEILIFDESTSALDAQMAAEIRKLIFESFAGRTIILVTHELAMVMGADHIIMLGEGRVAGDETHQALMEGCRAYRELVEEQTLKEVYA